MKVYVFGRFNIGDKIILEGIKNSLNIETVYLGEKVDLSKIIPEEHNLIVVINRGIQYLDFQKIMGYIKKDLTKPFMVVSKLRTFGALFLEPNLQIERIATNKIYPFAGVLYVPKAYMQHRMSDIFNKTKKEDMRFFIIDNRRKR